MNDYGYYAPDNMGEALKLLDGYRGKVSVLAGGTDLVPKINKYELKPDTLLYIGGLGMNFIKEDAGKIVIGAATTWTALTTDSLILGKIPMLADAASQGGSVATRNAGTIGGNIVNASPAADLVVALLSLDAELMLVSATGSRSVPINEFFTGRGETVRKPEELLSEIHVPFPEGQTSFIKIGRRKAMTLSVVNTSVRLIVNGGTCKDARIAIGAMAPIPLRCSTAEAMLIGKSIDGQTIQQCAEEAVAQTSPIDDQRASAWYRKKVGKVIVARALAQAAGIQY